MVYFIRVPDGPVKVGYTNRNVKERLKELQAASPYPLELIGTIAGGQQSEQCVHRMFSGWRSQGGREWYDADPIVIKAIDAMLS